MAQLAAVRSTIGTTGSTALGAGRDEVSEYIAGGIGSFGGKVVGAGADKCGS